MDTERLAPYASTNNFEYNDNRVYLIGVFYFISDEFFEVPFKVRKTTSSPMSRSAEIIASIINTYYIYTFLIETYRLRESPFLPGTMELMRCGVVPNVSNPQRKKAVAFYLVPFESEIIRTCE